MQEALQAAGRHFQAGAYEVTIRTQRHEELVPAGEERAEQ
jgi:hypothetical protein